MAVTQRKPRRRPAHAPKRIRTRYIPALDGLRAFAVLAVIAYHMSIGWAPGGLMGVTVFFVISGYLINGLLVSEHRRTGRISLSQFWLRRVRRIVPAVLLAVAGTVALSALISPSLLDKARPDILPSLLFYNNWWQIFHEVSYFEAAGAPSPLTHFWSLAIEEQFYIVWPLLLIALFHFKLKKRPMAAVILILAIASGIEMALMYSPATDPSRVYYGTDTRAMSLLVGAWLSLVWPSSAFGRRSRTQRSRTTWIAFNVAGVAAFVGIAAIVVLTSGFSPFPYRGGIALASVLSAVLIAVLVVPDTWVARFLQLPPFVWIGKRSYGMYLWHFPIILLTSRVSSTVEVPWWIRLSQLIVIIAVAELSYRFVEDPIRKGAIGNWLRNRKNKRNADTASRPGKDVSSRHAVQGERPSRNGDPSKPLRDSSSPSNQNDESSSIGQTPSPGARLRVAATAVVVGGLLVSAVAGVVLVKPASSDKTAGTLIASTIAEVKSTAHRVADEAGIPSASGAANDPEKASSSSESSTASDGAASGASDGSNLTAASADTKQEETPTEETPTVITQVIGDVNTAIEDNGIRNRLVVPHVVATVKDHLPDPSPIQRTIDMVLERGSEERERIVSEAYDNAFETPRKNKKGKPIYSPLLIGDSVSAGCIDEFLRVFPNGCIDAVPNRNIWESPYATYADAKQVGDFVVFCLGTNNAVEDFQIDELLASVSDDKKVIFVNTREPRDWEASTNAAIERAPERHKNVVAVVDWYHESQGHDEYFYDDGIHLTNTGPQAYIGLIRDALEKAAIDDALAQHGIN